MTPVEKAKGALPKMPKEAGEARNYRLSLSPYALSKDLTDSLLEFAKNMEKMHTELLGVVMKDAQGQ
eukprot:3960686-Alexandrium_andersonii.AAC.1